MSPFFLPDWHHAHTEDGSFELWTDSEAHAQAAAELGMVVEAADGPSAEHPDANYSFTTLGAWQAGWVATFGADDDET